MQIPQIFLARLYKSGVLSAISSISPSVRSVVAFVPGTSIIFATVGLFAMYPRNEHLRRGFGHATTTIPHDAAMLKASFLSCILYFVIFLP